MNEGTTIIVGAGAVLDFNHKGIVPLMKNITEEILNLGITKVDGTKCLLIKDLHNHIISRLEQVGRPEVTRLSPPQVNFEDMLHILEMCLAYSSCWHDEYLHWPAFPLFGCLFDPKPFLKKYNSIEFARAAYSLEKRVMDIINQYDSDFNKDVYSEGWYRSFWNSIGRADIFTLNYDSTIENSLDSYEDGFVTNICEEGYYRFSPKKYFENPDKKTTISHLHGSILYSEAKSFPFKYSIRDLVKNRDYTTACSNRINYQCAPCNQAKEQYIQPYIISGARKTDKMLYAPYNTYLSNLARKVMVNKRLIIIGYSLGDLYLNEILSLGMDAHGKDFKVVIIDKYSPNINTYPSLLQHIRNKCSSGTYTFISRLAQDRLYIEIGQKEYPLTVSNYDTPIISKNGNLLMCIGGFKNTVEKHFDIIKDFLN